MRIISALIAASAGMTLLTLAPVASAAPIPARPVAAAPSATRHAIVISEIWYNSPGRDTGSNVSLNHEWVQLHNTTGHALSLTGWTLRDAARHVYTFGSYRLPAHGYVRVHTGHGRDSGANRYWRHSWYIWNNTGDKATLRTSAGTTRATCKYSDPGESRAYTHC
jgi:hypothetical protein